MNKVIDKLLWSKNKVLRCIGFVLAPKVRGVCYVCGKEYCLALVNPHAPQPWTEEGKIECMECFEVGKRSKYNHHTFVKWARQKVKENRK